MNKIIELMVSPQEAGEPVLLEAVLRQQLKISPNTPLHYLILRRSVDARGRQVRMNLQVQVFVGELPPPKPEFKFKYLDISKAERVVVVGAGPAGMFAALRLIELGMKPILVERGKDVRARRRDLAAINKDQIVNPDSNYCFGEGGAGTYSDGKLYTRSKKRGDLRRVLEILVAHGATDQILVDTHPHIGTNKLPEVVQKLRESILEAGGEVHFNTRVEDFIMEGKRVKGVVTQTGNKLEGKAVILATGHSARDIFELLKKRNIKIEAKPFALGVRVEHPQELIDSIQYHCDFRGEYLPAASYSLVHQVNWKGIDRGVFSFCMCPGGFIVPAATSPGEIVVNGMSPSRRDSRYANSGIVVAIEKEDLKGYEKEGEFAALSFQKKIEQKAWELGGKTQVAPSQLLMDFVNKKSSSRVLESSYQPGLTPVPMDEIFPEAVAYRLREGFKSFGSKMRGYLTNEAQVVATESRTSSPVLIPRDRDKLEHTEVAGLFPCGEGAGYAGGIVSAAMDGERCAEAVFQLYR